MMPGPMRIKEKMMNISSESFRLRLIGLSGFGNAVWLRPELEGRK